MLKKGESVPAYCEHCSDNTDAEVVFDQEEIDKTIMTRCVVCNEVILLFTGEQL